MIVDVPRFEFEFEFEKEKKNNAGRFLAFGFLLTGHKYKHKPKHRDGDARRV